MNGERNWWKPRKGPGQRDIDPFYTQLNHSRLVVEVPVDTPGSLTGFLERLRAVPDEVVLAKQREIDRVRRMLIYDTSGSGHADAFTAVLREVIAMLPLRGGKHVRSWSGGVARPDSLKLVPAQTDRARRSDASSVRTANSKLTVRSRGGGLRADRVAVKVR